MKIGILTFHKPINYGAFLQSFSLSYALAKDLKDSSVEIIDYVAPLERKKVFINVLRALKHNGFDGMIKEILKIRSFRKAWDTLPLSKHKLCTENLNELYAFIDSNYDLLVIGSDAVFNWKQNGFPTAFIPDYEFKHCKVATYAASVHGLKYAEESQERIARCNRAFTQMKFIGVRDENTARFVKYCNESVSPIHCCDPTLFINRNAVKVNAGEYCERIEKKYNINLDEKFIVIMLPDSEMADRIAQKYGEKYRLISVFKKSRATSSFLYDLNPFEWAMLLSKAELVVTSYFHGALLSLVSSTPTIVVDYADYNEGVYEGKLKDLMKTRFDLPQLYYEKKHFEDLNNESSIFEVIDSALAGEYDSKIRAAVCKEASEYDVFIEFLNKHL